MRTLTLILALFPAVVWAQAHTPWTPVDQTVEDLDQLGTSLRRVEGGLRLDGEQTSLFRAPAPGLDPGQYGPAAPGQPQYYRIGPGFVARVDRLDYVVRLGRKKIGFNVKPGADGQFIDLISSGAVFELAPRHVVPGTPLLPESVTASQGPRYNDAPPPPDTYQDHRIDGRVNGRVDYGVDQSIGDTRLGQRAWCPYDTDTGAYPNGPGTYPGRYRQGSMITRRVWRGMSEKPVATKPTKPTTTTDTHPSDDVTDAPRPTADGQQSHTGDTIDAAENANNASPQPRE